MGRASAQASLFDLLIPPVEVEPQDPHGEVIQGEVDETLSVSIPKVLSPRIELHRHTDGRWMWAVNYSTGVLGNGYRVGPKWGKFTATREAALHYAVEEIRERLQPRLDRTDSQSEARIIRLILKWLAGLK